MDVTYMGPHDGVELLVAGEPVAVERGKTISVPDEIGEALLVQGLPEPELDDEGNPKPREIPEDHQPSWTRAGGGIRKPRRGDDGGEG